MTPTDPFYLGILILTGAFTGIISGLLGVGGGFIMSYPVLAFAGNRTAARPGSKDGSRDKPFCCLAKLYKCYSKIPAKASSALETGKDYGNFRSTFQFWRSGGSFSPAGFNTEHNFRDRGHNWST